MVWGVGIQVSRSGCVVCGFGLLPLGCTQLAFVFMDSFWDFRFGGLVFQVVGFRP